MADGPVGLIATHMHALNRQPKHVKGTELRDSRTLVLRTGNVKTDTQEKSRQNVCVSL